MRERRNERDYICAPGNLPGDYLPPWSLFYPTLMRHQSITHASGLFQKWAIVAAI
jgi:hypothetical protein